MDVDNGSSEGGGGGSLDIEQSLLQQFSCMGTTDKDELVQQLQKLLGSPSHLNYSTAAFFLDMNNWNLQAAICSYLDVESPNVLPSMGLVSDPDTSETESIEPNTRFQKSWHVCNNGVEPWPIGCYVQCSDGDNFGGSRVQLPAIKPGEDTHLTVQMTSPSVPGIYQSKWRACTHSGSYFGDPMWAILTVVEQGTIELTEQLSHFNELGSIPPLVPQVPNPFIPHMLHRDSKLQERCKFFVQRKKRNCKMLVKSGQEFCGEHQKPTGLSESTENDDTKIRILCPLDRKHTVFAHNLNKHLKICNARPISLEPYIHKDVNSGKSEVSSDVEVNDSFQFLCSFSKEKIIFVIEKLNEIFKKHVKLSDKMLTFEIVEKEMEKPDYGDKTKKHLKQASAILGLLDDYQMLKDNTCYIEFGAGRGQLSWWIAQATDTFDNSKILLIERASPKHKRDNKLAKTTNRIQRIRADISDLLINKLDMTNEVENIIGVTKHLCGEATDLAIRCMTNQEINKNKVHGAVFTFCCHHRCRWTPYTGKEFFEENNLTTEDFNIMCGLSSWATCGTGLSREHREKLRNGEIKGNEKDQDYGLSREEREEVGRKCKNIINWGRLNYLEKHNFHCSLHLYVEKSITLENVCIVAYKKSL